MLRSRNQLCSVWNNNGIRNMENLEIVCFSYNRGGLLQNCLRSISDCMPSLPVTVVDDGSSDEETRQIIERIRRSNRIRLIETTEADRLTSGNQRLGGLYGNMQRFQRNHVRTRFVLFLQDDTQIVRRFGPADMKYVADFFTNYPTKAFLYPVFQHLTRERYKVRAEYQSGLPVWFRVAGSPYSGMSAISIFDSDRLVEYGYVFGNSEEDSSARAESMFGGMGEMAVPFVGYVPAPRTYRYRQETWVYKIWSKRHTGVFPIDTLSEADASSVLDSFPSEIPSAKAFLTSRAYGKDHPWPVFRMHDASRIAKKLDQLEWRLRRILLGPPS